MGPDRRSRRRAGQKGRAAQEVAPRGTLPGEARHDRAGGPAGTGGSPWSGERAFRRVLAGILGLGLLIRLLHFWALSTTAYFKIPLVFTQSDMYAFWQWAQTILAGDVLGRHTYHPYFEWMKAIAPLETWYRWWGGREIFQQAPFYAYWVAFLSASFGSSVAAVTFVQLLLGAAQPLVMFALARRLFDARVGLLAAGLTAVYGPFIFHQGTLLRDWLPPLVEPLALLGLLRARASLRRLDWFLAGLTLGLAVLIKETVLLFVPLVVLWIVVDHRAHIRRAVGVSAVMLLGMLCMMGPLIARNALVGAPVLSVSNRAAEGLIEGNAVDGIPIGSFHPHSMQTILERSDGQVPTVIREILKTYQGDWLGFLKLQLLKARGLGEPMEVPNNLNFYYAVDISPALRVTFGYGVIFPLGLAGFILSLPTWRQHRLLALYGASTIAGLMAGQILGRYRLVLVPVLIVYGAAGVVRIVHAIQAREIGKASTCVGLILAMAVLQHVVIHIRDPKTEDMAGIYRAEYLYASQIYASEGNLKRAVAEIEQLQMIAKDNPGFPNLALQTHLFEGNFRALWAHQLLQGGDREAARRQTDLAAAAYAHQPHLGYPHSNLGMLYLALNERATARAYFLRYLELEPVGTRADTVRQALSTL